MKKSNEKDPSGEIKKDIEKAIAFLEVLNNISDVKSPQHLLNENTLNKLLEKAKEFEKDIKDKYKYLDTKE